MTTQQKKNPLSLEDKMLIDACKDERERLDIEIRELRAADRHANRERIKQLQRGRSELTDRKLAEKFGISKFHVERC